MAAVAFPHKKDCDEAMRVLAQGKRRYDKAQTDVHAKIQPHLDYLEATVTSLTSKVEPLKQRVDNLTDRLTQAEEARDLRDTETDKLLAILNPIGDIFPGDADKLVERVRGAHEKVAQLAAELKAAQDELAAVPKQADVDQLAADLQTARDALAAAPKQADVDQLNANLQAANAIKNEVLLEVGGDEAGLIARLQAADDAVKAQVAALPVVQAAQEAGTVAKVQSVLDRLEAADAQITSLEARAAVLDRVLVKLGVDDAQVEGTVALYDKMLEIVFDELFAGQAIDDEAKTRAAVQGLLGRVQQLDDQVAKANNELSHVQGADLNEKVENLRKELAEEMTFMGTVKRIGNGIFDGFVNTLHFIFVGFPKFCLESVTYLGGIFGR